jgi:uncharacterized membrane protein
MLTTSWMIVVFLLSIEAVVLLAAGSKRSSKFFDIIPPVFWIYFLPMLASTLGLIDPKAPVLGFITSNILPMALFLLLVAVDVKAIMRLGGKATGMFFIGSLGIMTGTVIAFFLFKNIIGPEFWAGFGALSASWTGGSANMIAVKEALGVPDPVFLPMVVVDTICPYVWMGFLIAGVCLQPKFDRWNRSDRTVLDALKEHARLAAPLISRLSVMGVLVLLVCALGAGVSAQYVARFLPQVKDVLTPYAWTIIVVSTLALGLSFTPARKLEMHGATRVGYWLLYFVLTSIGAKASLAHLGTSLVLIAAGGVIILVHVCFLLAGARMLRAPLFLVATASQANIGGVASAPVVAAVYEPGLASVGLLMAILGNIVGTYLGIITGHVCRWLGGVV